MRTCRSILSRAALVSDLNSKGVVNLVSDEVRQIYSLLEADFTPLELCQRLAPLLKQLESVTKAMSIMDVLHSKRPLDLGPIAANC